MATLLGPDAGGEPGLGLKPGGVSIPLPVRKFIPSAISHVDAWRKASGKQPAKSLLQWSVLQSWEAPLPGECTPEELLMCPGGKFCDLGAPSIITVNTTIIRISVTLSYLDNFYIPITITRSFTHVTSQESQAVVFRAVFWGASILDNGLSY